MEYKAAICDDEALELAYLSELVQNWAKKRGHRVRIFLFPSAEAFLFQYEEEKDFDLLRLDIEMGKMNGVELARIFKLRQSRRRDGRSAGVLCHSSSA